MNTIGLEIKRFKEVSKRVEGIKQKAIYKRDPFFTSAPFDEFRRLVEKIEILHLDLENVKFIETESAIESAILEHLGTLRIYEKDLKKKGWL